MYLGITRVGIDVSGFGDNGVARRQLTSLINPGIVDCTRTQNILTYWCYLCCIVTWKFHLCQKMRLTCENYGTMIYYDF